MLVLVEHSSNDLLLCSAKEINAYRFGMTGWLNDDRIDYFSLHGVPMTFSHDYNHNIAQPFVLTMEEEIIRLEI